MEQYTEVTTIKISKIQKETLNKLKERNIRVSDFIRKAISEKLKSDAKELIIKPIKEYCPF
jgi:post-segregation antitoxin (ccd killing protein)